MKWFFDKNKKVQIKDYDRLREKTLEELDEFVKGLNDDNYIAKYDDIKKIFVAFFNALFKTNTNYTGEEIIKRLHGFNIKHNSIEKLKTIISKADQIDYYGKFLSKEDVLFFSDALRTVILEICEEKKEGLYEKKKHVFSHNQEDNTKKLEKELKNIKEGFHKNGKIDERSIIRTKSYFNALHNTDKEKYAKEVHYYCERLPLFFNLLNEAEKFGKDLSEFHNILSQINHLFIKLDDKEKEYVYPRILKLTSDGEEKLNIYLMLAYSYLHQKKLEAALFFYKKLDENYKLLDAKKKTYYYSLIQRFVKRYNLEKNKIEKHV